MASMKDKYNTPLTPEEKKAYDKWIADQKAKGRDLSRDTEDYDLQGLFKDKGPVDFSKGAHGPDTYKKPTHPTFSDESKYHGVDGYAGGTWGQDAEGHDTFTPSPTNLKNMSAKELQAYFDKVEPNNRLIMPEPDMAAQMYPTMGMQ